MPKFETLQTLSDGVGTGTPFLALSQNALRKNRSEAAHSIGHHATLLKGAKPCHFESAVYPRQISRIFLV
jgi:hypothetical protein